MNSLRSLLVVAGLGAALAAQGGGSATTSLPSASGVLPVAGTVDARNALLLPAPPRGSLAPQAPKRTLTPVFTPGAARDLAPGAPTAPGAGGAILPAGGALVAATNQAVTPTGASVSQTTEPTAAIHRDTALYTANWFAAISSSSGQGWTHVSPYTAFPAADGGFCCDQYALYVPGTDTTCMVIWLLQYGFSATTGSGRHRIAVAVGRENLQRQLFHYYDLSPQTVGYPTNRWFDFPHIARSNTWLYIAANVFDQNSGFQGSSMIRLHLDDVRAARSATANWRTTPNTEPASHRLSDGATTTMYWGTHWRDIFGAPMIRMFAWDDGSASVTVRDRLISAWYNTPSSSIGPDGRDWLGSDDHRILGAYLANGALSFLWGSDGGGPFAQPFTRIVGFAPATNFNLIGEASVWHPSIAWACPSAAVNGRGDVGGSICFGGGGLHPSTAVWVVDAQGGWGPLTHTVVAAGSRGPAGNRWGDYLSATRHPSYPNTYVGTAFSLDAQGNSVPRYTWFGRENDLPNFSTVNVTSTPIAGVAITVDVPDRNGAQNGTTNFARVYSGVQGMTWTAPALATVNGAAYAFERWRFNATLQPVGERNLLIADLQGVVSNTVEARYLPVLRTLTVSSTPFSGVTISVNPPDLNNRLQGATQFTLAYNDGATFDAFAPSTAGTNALFDRWVLDGVPQTPGATTLRVRARADHQLVAQYRVPTCGSFTSYGSSCMVGFGYRHIASSSRATCGPWIGDTVNYGVELASLGSLGGVLWIGASRTTWNGFPLPLPVPNQPGCSLYTDMLATVGFGIDNQGRGGVNGLVLPNIPGLISARLYTQCVAIGGFGFHQFSNGIETLIGGLQ